MVEKCPNGLNYPNIFLKTEFLLFYLKFFINILSCLLDCFPNQVLIHYFYKSYKFCHESSKANMNCIFTDAFLLFSLEY